MLLGGGHPTKLEGNNLNANESPTLSAGRQEYMHKARIRKLEEKEYNAADFVKTIFNIFVFQYTFLCILLGNHWHNKRFVLM